jgi:protein-tyrosine phosphatase
MTKTSRIGPRLYQGSAPPTGKVLRALGWDVIVLCAEEYQPAGKEFPGLTVIHAPNDDADRAPTAREWEIARSAAALSAIYVRDGKRVLVTCMAGRNRSGLVSALALRYLTGASGAECARRVQLARENALSNPHFVRALSDLRASRAWGPQAVYL